ncbi:REP-associated tyrosine transposase [Thiohalorhabdus sp.]|uniref:REP-associated tyrosine transposase n=1 Tax=Thiohalorhabdus sp. TaxID=3094134 RepID=UPI002FC3258B
MARPLRIEYPGALYHVTARGNARDWIYLDDEDRQGLVDLLGEVVGSFNWALHAYCLMGNHYHLLVETPEANLGRGMRQLNGVYTQRFNRCHGRVGHVFQGRYKAILVEKEAYLLELARYIVLNPVRAGLVEEACDWPWSSCRATAGLDGRPPWLNVDWLLAAFSTRADSAGAQYRRFVAEGVGRGSPWQELTGQVYLGSEAFVREAASREAAEASGEVPRPQRRPAPPPLTELAAAHPRDEAIARAYASGGYTLREIGEYFGLHYSRVSRIVRRAGEAKSKT